MQNIYSFINYIECPPDMKNKIINGLSNLGIQISSQLIDELNKSTLDKLPQYVFLYKNHKMIGYLFIIGDKILDDCFFHMLAQHNADELPANEAKLLLLEGIRICSQYQAEFLIKCFQNDLNELLFFSHL